MQRDMNSYQVGVAAEAYAAALFAQAGCDVLVQYGANQPEYDLVVSRRGRARRISVKGSQDGGWVLAASHKRRDRTYHDAVDAWASKHSDPQTLFCFVQFKDVDFGVMPRMYLATISEVVAYLKASCGGHGYTSVRENHTWASGKAARTTDTIPAAWRMTASRIAALVDASERAA